MASMSRPIDSRISSPCSLNSGARCGCGGYAAVLHRRAGQLERGAVGGRAVDDVAVGDGLRVGGGLRACPARSSTGRRSGSSDLAPLVGGAPGDHLAAASSAAAAALAVRPAASAKRSSVASSGRPISAHSSAQYGRPGGRRTTRSVPSWAAVGARRAGCRSGRPTGGGAHGMPSWSDSAMRRAHRPQADAEQRHVDGGGLAGALAVEQRAHDPAGDRHGADRVAERGGGRAGARVVVGLLDAHRDPGAVPVGEDVVGAPVGVRAPLALAGAAHVDDRRVVGPDVVDVDLELGAHARQLVGEEHVAGGGELVEDVEAVRRR